MIWNLDCYVVRPVSVRLASQLLNDADFASVCALPIGGRHVNAVGDTWERIE